MLMENLLDTPWSYNTSDYAIIHIPYYTSEIPIINLQKGQIQKNNDTQVVRVPANYKCSCSFATED